MSFNILLLTSENKHSSSDDLFRDHAQEGLLSVWEDRFRLLWRILGLSWLQRWLLWSHLYQNVRIWNVLCCCWCWCLLLLWLHRHLCILLVRTRWLCCINPLLTSTAREKSREERWTALSRITLLLRLLLRQLLLLLPHFVHFLFVLRCSEFGFKCAIQVLKEDELPCEAQIISHLDRLD